MTAGKRSPSISAGHHRGPSLCALFSGLAIVALFAVLGLVRPVPTWNDGGSGPTSVSGAHVVSQRVIESYCPARPGLADSRRYGDSRYQSSAGDIMSAARFTAFGSVFSSTLTSVGNRDGKPVVTLSGSADDAMRQAAGNTDRGALWQTTQLLKAATGSGQASATASWATRGDLRGIAAATCLTPALEQTFLLPQTRQGWTQRLIVSNPSSKSTVVKITLWGTGASGPLALNTTSSLTVGAQAEASYDLSASAPGQDGLFATISSGQTPVAAMVQASVMNGLSPLGVDYLTPVPQASRSAVIPGMSAGDRLHVLLFSPADTRVTLSWVTEHGQSDSRQVELRGSRLQVVDLGRVPQGVHAVAVDASHALHAAGQIDVAGRSGQSDFAVATASEGAASSAIALPEGAQATVTVANPGARPARAALTAYNAAGSVMFATTIQLPAHAATVVPAKRTEGASALTVREVTATVTWNTRLGNTGLDARHVAGIGILNANPLTPVRERIYANPSYDVVR